MAQETDMLRSMRALKKENVLIGFIGDPKVFKNYIYREIHPDDRKCFVHIGKPEDEAGRRFDHVIRIHGWKNYEHLYNIAKSRLKG